MKASGDKGPCFDDIKIINREYFLGRVFLELKQSVIFNKLSGLFRKRYNCPMVHYFCQQIESSKPTPRLHIALFGLEVYQTRPNVLSYADRKVYAPPSPVPRQVYRQGSCKESCANRRGPTYFINGLSQAREIRQTLRGIEHGHPFSLVSNEISKFHIRGFL